MHKWHPSLITSSGSYYHSYSHRPSWRFERNDCNSIPLRWIRLLQKYLGNKYNKLPMKLLREQYLNSSNRCRFQRGIRYSKMFYDFFFYKRYTGKGISIAIEFLFTILTLFTMDAFILIYYAIYIYICNTIHIDTHIYIDQTI